MGTCIIPFFFHYGNPRGNLGRADGNAAVSPTKLLSLLPQIGGPGNTECIRAHLEWYQPAGLGRPYH